MPKPTGYEGVISLHRRGVITDLEAVNQIIDYAGESDVKELVSRVPAALIVLLKERLATAPTSDEGWGRTIHIFGGTSPRVPSYDREAEQVRRRAVYRKGIEALRFHFGTAGSGTDEL
jgi:hypothetical protein